MSEHPHNALVSRQFGAMAQAYLASATHASGEDLALLTELVGHKPQALVLDMGCGAGHASFTVAPRVAKVVAYDLSPEMLALVATEAGRRGLGNIVTKQGAAERLPYPDASFDLVMTRYSSHHWQDIQAGLRQMRRVLKPGGVGIFMDVISPGRPLLDTWLQSLELLRDPSHVRNGSPAQWRQLLAEAGFALTDQWQFKLPLDFAAWVARMQTPQVQVDAIRALQRQASTEVSDYFDFADDGSFRVDTGVFVARGI
ncbi:class I SAM-dependent methyltransferase [Gallaecimonas xiamenensis]|uniref:UbiE/COQ5 family methyltransferase n=1 Tax=Gallaecimonas xiamenensis 3-C-1 TaxID=745411 RepID=K2JEB8_9GAMM|nr:class I SAM-dependent methyltransferase [Gallaecimonas xiamenensis]EKE72987.1 UbiE/COQ5 family methyltransferase [Gallaecimonas xiamenensis 3-C-1]